MSTWTAKSHCLSYHHTKAETQAVSELSPIWNKIQHPAAGVRVFEEVTGNRKPDINQHHLLMCAPGNAVSDASVPTLQSDAEKWRAVAFNVPGMKPEMVTVADLLACTDEYMTQKLNDFLENEGVAPVAHVSQLFGRMKNKYTMVGEIDALRAAGTKFFNQYGVSLAEMEPPWKLVMEWRSKRIAFAHPLLRADGGIDMQQLTNLETVVNAEPDLAQVKLAVGVMVEAAKEMAASA